MTNDSPLVQAGAVVQAVSCPSEVYHVGVGALVEVVDSPGPIPSRYTVVSAVRVNIIKSMFNISLQSTLVKYCKTINVSEISNATLLSLKFVYTFKTSTCTCSESLTCTCT